MKANFKAVLHLKNDGYFCHRRVGIEVNFDSAPKEGDMIYLCQEDYDRLFKVLNDWEDYQVGKGHHKRGGDYDPYRDWWDERNEYYRCWSGGLTVTGIAYYPAEDADGNNIPGEYVLHVEGDDGGR